ncbi:FecR family protein [Williamwhitmania taraxaci]|uniref:FecR family protein n=1 Tax=Williamwhitmania taraxaci TaxID=1640674 RepID=A0A1G6LZ45_9BACT|nr:FecR family protein [Williamwhitmania taraxaci]SDC48568.1 FecR family protein [Williamwhitmania taraxaci]
MKRKENSGPTKEEMREIALFNNLRFLRAPATISKEDAWLQLMGRLSENRTVATTIFTRSLTFRALLAAATIAIFLVSYYFIALSGSITLTTGNGQMVTAYLPDSSVVYLNSGTTIRYNTKHWNDRREIKLEGEAFFKVKAGRRFSVITSESVTSVLGTSFNVYARANEVKVSCITGKVLVMSKSSGESKLLLPGYKTKVLKGARVQREKTNIDLEAKWVEGKFYFQQESIGRVLEEIERQYNIKIEYKGNTNRTYTGFFTNNDLPSALDLVCIPMQLRYKRVNAITIQVY